MDQIRTRLEGSPVCMGILHPTFVGVSQPYVKLPDVQKLVKESYTRRDEERQRRIEELENTGNREHARVLRQQKRAERTDNLRFSETSNTYEHGGLQSTVCPELKFPYTRKWIPQSVLSGR
jgi:hypothetical protein